MRVVISMVCAVLLTTALVPAKSKDVFRTGFNIQERIKGVDYFITIKKGAKSYSLAVNEMAPKRRLVLRAKKIKPSKQRLKKMHVLVFDLRKYKKPIVEVKVVRYLKDNRLESIVFYNEFKRGNRIQEK